MWEAFRKPRDVGKPKQTVKVSFAILYYHQRPTALYICCIDFILSLLPVAWTNSKCRPPSDFWNWYSSLIYDAYLHFSASLGTRKKLIFTLFGDILDIIIKWMIFLFRNSIDLDQWSRFYDSIMGHKFWCYLYLQQTEFMLVIDSKLCRTVMERNWALLK